MPEDIGTELASGTLKRRPRRALGLTEAAWVQVFRLEDGYAVELNPFFPDDFHTDGEERKSNPAAARREALAFFRRIAAPKR